jgi:polyphosphate kinase
MIHFPFIFGLNNGHVLTPFAKDISENLIDRELSWLDFNERVLELAEDESVPLLERVRFLAIFSSNLDDFYMIRVATVKRKILNGQTQENSAGHTPNELLAKLLAKSKDLADRQAKLFHLALIPALAEKQIKILAWDKLDEKEKISLNEYFINTVFPVLTPLAVDPSHPFPYISGLSLNLAVIVSHKGQQGQFFARVKVPPVLPRFVTTGKTESLRFVTLEDLISANLETLFPGMTIEDYFTFRVTRNQDFELDEEDSEDLLETMEQELLRRRFGPPVRLEVDRKIKSELLQKLVDELEITQNEVILNHEPIDLTSLNQIADLDRKELKFPIFKSRTPKFFLETENENSETFFNSLRKEEVLLHHPYQSFTTSVVRFLETAASDPQVLAIKQTLYRTSGDSPIVDALIEAAEAGKQVLAVVEIRARFDELANVRWARKLESAGVHVVYGLMGMKTHAKLSLVVREEASGLRRYCHVGTGNYNPKTARLYEDWGLLSSDPELGHDLSRLFNQLSGFVVETQFSRLLVAPKSLRSGLLLKIENEIQNAKAGLPSGIRFKLNSLLDEEFVDALYRASSAGVKVDLITRGICALKPGIPGLSENIRVRSILGRFLEHSRIFNFANGGESEYWIGSADLMERNLDRRVEALVQIKQGNHLTDIDSQLNGYLAADIDRWELGADGHWVRIDHDEHGNKLVELHSQLIESSKK